MKRLALSLMVCAFASAASWEKHGDSYEKKTAAAKQAELWTEITANQESYGWYSAASLAGIFVEPMEPSL